MPVNPFAIWCVAHITESGNKMVKGKLPTLARNWARAFLQPVPLLGVLGLPKYISDWFGYSRKAGTCLGLMDSQPCLTDRVVATPFDPHYFFQGAWLARKVAQCIPVQHVDVSSSVMTIAALSGFVDTIFVDYRPLQVSLPGLDCRAGDITRLPFADDSVESLSCLHVIEHIGLGRYGDALDPQGSLLAAKELQRVLLPGGNLYLSAPVGRERVCFNAHRVFAPDAVVSMFGGIDLVSFSCVDDAGNFVQDSTLQAANSNEYACGLFHFRKR
jgi:SAM-dependent methyltransferase